MSDRPKYLLVALLISASVSASPDPDSSRGLVFVSEAQAVDSPSLCITEHNVGNIVLAVANDGTFGDYNYSYNRQSGSVDCFTGDPVRSCEYPRGSARRYLYAGAFWIGAVVNGRDTVVSTGADGWGGGGRELSPDKNPDGVMTYRSTVDPTIDALYQGAVSEEDWIAVYYDTCLHCKGVTQDKIDFRSHRPLHIEVTQRTYAWSYGYADDFVLFDYTIRNIGLKSLAKLYMGIYVDADVEDRYNDICGFRPTNKAWYSTDPACDYVDSLNIAWIADDADLAGIVPNVTGTRVVRTPTADATVSFNWWVSDGRPNYDFGPQLKRRFRDLGTDGGQGTPEGDRNKYWYLKNGEMDYDQIYAKQLLGKESDYTTPDEEFAAQIAVGFDTRYLLSFGPFNLSPGQSLPLSFAYVGGLNFHKSPENIKNLPNNPDEYYRNVDFSNLAYNATWADWVYDNPGVDTDSDGYAGKYHLCQTGDSTLIRIDTSYNADSSQIVFLDSIWKFDNEDTIWYKGDGVPDFRAASPPPRPDIRTIMATGKIVVQFNGWRSETARDFFTHKVDFEGYRVYLSRDDRWSSFSLLDTYDKENYDKFVWDTAVGDNGEFVLKNDPFTMSQLQCLYAPAHCADSSWNPLIYTRNHPYQSVIWSDSIFYFAAHDFNRSEPGVNTNIRKLYPEAPFPKSLNKDSCLASDTTEDGYFKHFEYEYTIDNLLPTVPYFISVTTFDFGAQNLGMPPMESPRTENPIHTYAEESSDSVVAKGTKVTVYPNPYRLDAGYAQLGYEGRGPGERDRPSDRNRRIHFYNLPAECTIKIFSLDGDLVRQIDHNVPSWDPMSNHETWDLITRNTQLAVSGLYYWTVESGDGQVQIGKLVIIM